MATTPMVGITAAVSINPRVATRFLSWAACPTASGKIMLPAPKNMENIARPMANDDDLNKFFTRATFSVVACSRIKSGRGKGDYMCARRTSDTTEKLTRDKLIPDILAIHNLSCNGFCHHEDEKI